VIIAAVFLVGVLISVFSMIWTNTLQELVPPEKLGRVSSVDQLGSFVLLPIGFGLAGWLTQRIGAPPVFVIGGLATTLMVLAGLTIPAVRELD
jgi:MFS family permease